MKNKPQQKKQWQAPEIIDLNVKNTKGGTSPDPTKETISSFSSYYISS